MRALRQPLWQGEWLPFVIPCVFHYLAYDATQMQPELKSL